MKTSVNVQMFITDTAYTKLEAFIKKYALNTLEQNNLVQLLKAGFIATSERKEGRKKIKIMSFVYEQVDDILLYLLRRYTQYAVDSSLFAITISHIENYGSLEKS